jgi:RNA polymerase sigma-70 factor (ECF subfamily)
VSAAEDQADVDRVLAGNLEAFEGIVRRWQGPLINLAYRFCRDRGRAEEMAQEAFLRAFNALGQWRREAMFSTWLFSLATRLYCTQLRRIPIHSLSLDDIPEPRNPERTDAGLAEEETARALRRALDTLPPKYREPLLLYYFHELDVTAAARTLGLPEGTLKARLSRGRDLLRAKLAQVSPLWQQKEA